MEGGTILTTMEDVLPFSSHYLFFTLWGRFLFPKRKIFFFFLSVVSLFAINKFRVFSA